MKLAGRTVTARVCGGLGNQLFIYAAARALALREGRDLFLDKTLFEQDITYNRVFLLDRLPRIAGTVARHNFHRDHSRLARPISRILNCCMPRRWRALIAEPAPSRFVPEVVRVQHCRRHLLMDGYWQSERYFAGSARALRDELQLPADLDDEMHQCLARINAARHPVAVGIRFFRDVPAGAGSMEPHREKYLAAINAIRERMPDAEVFVFSDEPELASAFLGTSQGIVLVPDRRSNREAFKHLHLMTHCAEYVIGVSSYHWWGAWLSKARGARVHFIATQRGVNDEYVPSSWHVM